MRSAIGFIIFLSIFLSIYGGMHAYVFWKAQAAFHFSWRSGLLIGFVLAFMALNIIIGFTLRSQGFALLSKIILSSGYIWTGFIFLGFSIAVTTDLYRLLIKLLSVIPRVDLSFAAPSPTLAFYIIIAGTVILNVYGFFEARNIRVEHLEIKTEKLPSNIDRLRIVQISDVHVGVMVGEGRLKKIAELVTEQNPDIFVSTGDLIDGDRSDGIEVMSALKNISAPFGKFAITGNHEFYAGLEMSLKLTAGAGFTMLRDQAEVLDGLINIVGIDDRGRRNFDRTPSPEKELLESLPQDKFTLLLKHQPFIDRESVGLFDLQLSGHTHKGQIFPFSLVTKIYYPRVYKSVHAGWLDLGKGSMLYVNRGTGWWGPPIRVMSPPEITVVDLVRP